MLVYVGLTWAIGSVHFEEEVVGFTIMKENSGRSKPGYSILT